MYAVRARCAKAPAALQNLQLRAASALARPLAAAGGRKLGAPLLGGQRAGAAGFRRALLRELSSGEQKKSEDADESAAGEEDDEDDDRPLTAAEKVQVAFWYTVYGAIAILVGGCLYFIGRELFPSAMSPNSLFNAALKEVKGDLNVTSKLGEPIKGFGRDHGGHREGRRNFIDHYEYKDPKDGSSRVRIRFNIEGPHGKALVFAEASSKLASGEWVYLMVQDLRDGSTSVLCDNRAKLELASASNKEDASIFGGLLGGGSAAPAPKREK